MALTDPGGEFDVSNVDIYGGMGFVAENANAAGGKSVSDFASSSVTFSTTTTTSTLGPANGITTGHDFSGLRGLVGDALTSIPSLPGAAPASVLLEVDAGGVSVDVLSGSTIDLNSTIGTTGLSLDAIAGDDVTSPTNLYVKLNPGLNVIDFGTGDSALALTNANFLVDGPDDGSEAFASFAFPTKTTGVFLLIKAIS